MPIVPRPAPAGKAGSADGPRDTVPPAPAYTGDAGAYREALGPWLDQIRALARDSGWLRRHAQECGYPLPGDLAAAGSEPWPAHHLAWRRLCQRYPELRRHSASPWNEAAPPAPLGEAEVARLVATLLHPRRGALLLAVLLDVLAGPIAEIALAVSQEGRP